MTMLEKLQYPIGKFDHVEPSSEEIKEKIEEVRRLPELLRLAVKNVDEQTLDTPYRPGGWTLRQVLHHLADSHMNAFIRMKLALTEDNPTIKPYFEDRWARHPDAALPIEPSLKILEGLHERWTVLLKSLNDADFNRTFYHPEHNRSFSLKLALAMYAWHSKHHLAHINQTLKNHQA